MSDTSRREFNRMIREECPKPKYLDKFWDYMDKNPDAFPMYLHAAKRMQRDGYKRFGVKQITEDIRYKTAVALASEEGLKLSNSLTAYFARHLIFIRPSLGDLIELKPLGRRNRARPDEEPRAYDPSKDEPMSHRLREFWQTGDESTLAGSNGRKR